MEPLYVSAFLKEEGPSCIVSTYMSQVAYQIVYSLGRYTAIRYNILYVTKIIKNTYLHV